MKQKVLFIDTAHPILEKGLKEMGMECVDGTKWDTEKIKNEVHAFSGIVIRSRVKLDQEFLSHAAGLRFIARVGAGMEGIDTSYAEKKGIVCLNAPEGNRDAVGEHALGMLLSLMNNLSRADRQVREGKWIREANRGIELNGKTVGLIGFGNTGSAFAKKMKGFEVSILAYDKYKKHFSDELVTEVSMEEIFAEADVLSLHVPLTEETRYLVNDTFLNRFRKNIFLINTSRGPIVKTDDLVKNIESGKVRGACLDVLEYEEGSFENIGTQKQGRGTGDRKQGTRVLPMSMQYLIQSDRVLLSPHIAGWTNESHEKLAKVLVFKIKNLKL